MTALLIIDAQVNMFTAEVRLHRAEQMLAVLVALIERARAAGVPVVYLQNFGAPGEPDEPGSEGWEIHPVLAPRQEDEVIPKRFPDGFQETGLAHALAARGIRRLVMAGMQTEVCIDATCRRAAELGYDVTLVADGHSTFSSMHRTAADLVSRHNQALESCVSVVPSTEIEL